MKTYAIVLFDAEKLEPIEHRVYLENVNRFEKKFIQEFIEFGRKEFIRKLKAPEDEFVIEIANGSALIYITIMDEIGLAMLVSNVIKLDETPHLVSKKIISDYTKYDMIPKEEVEISRYFKQKELLMEVVETKQVLLRTISKVIDRGEHIEDLVDKTDLLSEQSKMFFKNSRKFNSCCWIFPRPRWKK